MLLFAHTMGRTDLESPTIHQCAKTQLYGYDGLVSRKGPSRRPFQRQNFAVYQGPAAKTTRQTAAITGAGDDIGRALAINLNERGIDLYLCDISQGAWIQRWQCWTQPGHPSPQPS